MGSKKIFINLMMITNCMLFAPLAPAAIINFTADAGPTGNIYDDVTHTKLAQFFFNISDIVGATVPTGVEIGGQWSLPASIIGFHVDFNDVFTFGTSTRHITHASFENKHDFSGGPSSFWSDANIGPLVYTTSASLPNDPVATGEYWFSNIYFNIESPGTLGFKGYIEVADAATVPEPQTFALLLAGVGGLAFFARRKKI